MLTLTLPLLMGVGVGRIEALKERVVDNGYK